MKKDFIDVIKLIIIAVILVLAFAWTMFYCSGCAHKEFNFDDFWSDSSTRIETSGQEGLWPAPKCAPQGVHLDPVYTFPTGLGDGSYTTLE